MTHQLKPYLGSHQNVVVYDTYADGGKIHFDVFLVTDKRSTTDVPEAIDLRAREVASQFLSAMGASGASVEINRCRRCHIDDTDAYKGQLWDLDDALIWPIDGCHP